MAAANIGGSLFCFKEGVGGDLCGRFDLYGLFIFLDKIV